jgi:hypothetical protein
MDTHVENLPSAHQTSTMSEDLQDLYRLQAASKETVLGKRAKPEGQISSGNDDGSLSDDDDFGSSGANLDDD